MLPNAKSPANEPTQYGHFSDDGSEYIITDPTTPRPWVNFLTNGDYTALCSHLGGGFSFYLDHRFNSVLRRGDHQFLEDLPARLFYLKDEDSGEVWTANVLPFGKYDTFEARQGIGYTTIASSYAGVTSDVRYFVPQGIDAELWELELTNHSDRPRRLSVYSVADIMMGNVSLDETDNYFMALFNDVIIDGSTMYFIKKWWHPHYGWTEENGIWKHRIAVTTTVTPSSMMSNREAFIGAFRGYHNPIALESATLPQAPSEGKQIAAVYQWRITLEPGERWGTKLAVNAQTNEDNEENRALVAALQHPQSYADAWQRTREYFSTLFAGVEVQTPDPLINTMANYWNKYQAMVNFYCGRGPSYYHKGQYQGMRDSCQDAFGMIALSPALARTNILRIASFFFADGRCCGGCNRIGLPEGPADKSDLPLWLILTVSDYLRETGEFSLLDEHIPLMDGGTSTIYQKMIAGIDRMCEERGSHGLPLMGHGDWNDAANAVGAEGKGESVWLGMFLYFVIQEMAPLMERRGEVEKLQLYQARAQEIWGIVNEQCWDGEWFVRAFKDDGSPLGVKGQREGYIWINAQTWAVIANISSAERLNACMDAVETHMGTEFGLMNLAPAYRDIDESIGLITRFLHGWKENAAVFSHASSFNVVARAMLGRGKDAVDLFTRLLPGNKAPDQYMMEPYVFSQFCVGPSCPDEFGRGAYHWLTGTAAWMFRAMADYIIGVHPLLDGLRISPAIDPTWQRFSMRRQFRGATYFFEFTNPGCVETGVAELYLDGVRISGNVLPLPTAAEHHVRVLMG